MSWWCPYPYTSLSSDTLGNYALCCEAKPSPHHCNDMSLKDFDNSGYMKKVRRIFKSSDPRSFPEIKHACVNCIKKEEQGGISKRLRGIDHYNKRAEKNKTNYMLELKLIGNICNYACLMCAPKSSSKIAEEEGLNYPKYFDLSKDWWKDFDDIAWEYNVIKFSGGEPFMSPTFKKIIQRLEDIGHTDVKIKFNTNGSGPAKIMRKMLKTFSHVSVNFSIDAWGKRNEVIRKHSTWEFTQERLLGYSNLCNDHSNFRFGIHPCVSILNVGYLHEFENLFNFLPKSKNQEFSISNTLYTPEEYNIYHLPSKVKDYYLEKNDKFFKSDMCNRPEGTINLLKEKSIKKFTFERLKKQVPNWKEWYPEFIEYD